MRVRSCFVLGREILSLLVPMLRACSEPALGAGHGLAAAKAGRTGLAAGGETLSGTHARRVMQRRSPAPGRPGSGGGGDMRRGPGGAGGNCAARSTRRCTGPGRREADD